MARIAELDLPDRLAPTIPVWATQIGFAVLCLGAAGLTRIAFTAIAPGGAPFALVYPAVLVATLFARWPAGAITGTVSIGYAWYMIFPVAGSFRFANAAESYSVLVIALSALITLIIAEAFRRAVRRATTERDRQIADRDLFLAEFDHRVKNNFAIVASLLDMQRRRADPATAEALSAALLRIDSIARAHRHLYRGNGGPGAVGMRDYLGELCATLTDVLSLRGGVTLRCACDDASLPRDRAVSIGLVVNELVTNAAKHAFIGRETGVIEVAFSALPDGWLLRVADNGTGLRKRRHEPGYDGGLGTRLIDAFARQADGTLETVSGPDGTTITLELTA